MTVNPRVRSRRRGAGLRDRSRSAALSLRAELSLFPRLFEYTRPYRGRLMLSWLATAGYAAAGSLILLQVKPVFDKALALGVDVGRLSLTILLLYVVKGACSYFSTTLVADAGQRAVTDLRNRLYEHILNQSFAFLGRSTTGSLMSHITTDVEKIQAAVSEIAGDLLKEGLTVLGFLMVLLLPRLAAGDALAGGPARDPAPAAAPGPEAARLQRDLAAPLEGHLGDPAGDDLGLPGGQGLRHGGLRDRPLPAGRGAPAERQHADHAHHGGPAPADGGRRRAGLGGGALLRQLRDPQGHITVGAFASFLAALFAMYTPIKRLSRVNATLQAALAAGHRVFDVLDRHDEVPEATPAVVLPRMRQGIEYRRVGFRYADGHGEILRDVSFSARPGEVVAIVGTSGSGKTTLVNLLPRFYDVTDGAILIDGVDIRKATLESLRAQIGLVTQETVLFNDTVRANIAYGLDDVDEARVESAARAAFAHDFILDLPRRYDTVIGERGSRLSGGQKQRIAIARAILKDPPDPHPRRGHLGARHRVRAAGAGGAREPHEGPHDARDRAPADHRARRRPHRGPRRGRGAARKGTHEELLRQPGGIYARLHELQFAPEAQAI